MNTTFGFRSILLALGLGFSLATACFDESVLENEACLSNADCGSSQECVRTDYQAMNTTEAFGWCRPKGEGCAVGIQPGCECLVDGGLQPDEPVIGVRFVEFEFLLQRLLLHGLFGDPQLALQQVPGVVQRVDAARTLVRRERFLLDHGPDGGGVGGDLRAQRQYAAVSRLIPR